MIKRSCLVAVLLAGCPAPPLSPLEDAAPPDAALGPALIPVEELEDDVSPPYRSETRASTRDYREVVPDEVTRGEVGALRARGDHGLDCEDQTDNDGDGLVDENVNPCGVCAATPREYLTFFRGRNHGESGTDEDCDGLVDEGFLGSLCETNRDCTRYLSCVDGHCTRPCADCTRCDELVDRITEVDHVTGESYVSWGDEEMMLHPDTFERCQRCLVACGEIGGLCVEGLCYREPDRVGECRPSAGETRRGYLRVWVEPEYDTDTDGLTNIIRLTRPEVYCDTRKPELCDNVVDDDRDGAIDCDDPDCAVDANCQDAHD